MPSVDCHLYAHVEPRASIALVPDLSQANREEGFHLWPRWVRNDKVNKIKNLPIFPAVHDQILNGVPDAEIARVIQDHGLFKDEALITIQGWLGHYRATVPKSLLMVRHIPAKVFDAYRKVKASLDPIAEIDQLYRWQKERVERVMRREKEIDFLIPNAEKEIAQAAKLLEMAVKLRNDIGLTDKQMGEAVQSSSNQLEKFDMDKVYSREGINEKLRDPASRMKILGAVENMLQLVSRRVEKGGPIEAGDSTESGDVAKVGEEKKDDLEVLGNIDLSGIDVVAGESSEG